MLTRKIKIKRYRSPAAGAALPGLHDSGEARRLENEVRRLNTDLERRVEERTAELQSANDELESFAYAVSHDLRAPLRAMGGFSLALKEDLGPRLEGQERFFLDQIIQASSRMADLIDGILRLSRASRGKLTRRWVDLTAMAHGIRRDLEAAGGDRRVEWILEHGLRAWGDPDVLDLLLRTLLDNAWKFTAGSHPALIRLTAVEGGFQVADNGAGFDMAHASKLYLPFQRLHRQDEFPGLGIGLATAHRLVRRHGGTLEAQAELGKGATFTVLLPGPSVPESEAP
jgi:signal transduction histidine kinase